MATKRSDLVENPKSMESLLRGFHGRDLKSRADQQVPLLDEDAFRCIGRSKIIYYKSDKRDPNDPKGLGQQGYWKDFYHKQGPLSVVWWYCEDEPNAYLSQLADTCDDDGFTREALSKKLPPNELPNELLELGVLVAIDLEVAGKIQTVRFENFKLFVGDDMKTLYALVELDGILHTNEILVWRSHKTYVCYRGIVD